MSTTANKAELLPGRSFKIDSAGVVTEATREFQVLRTFGANEFNVADITGLPDVGATHPVYTSLKVQSYEPREDGNGRRWVVAVLYGVGQPATNVTSGTFTGRVIRVSYGTSETQRDLAFDADVGLPVLTTAGDPFESVPQVGVCDTEIRIQRQDNLSPSTVFAFNGTVNDASVTIQGVTFPAYTARLTIAGEAIEHPDYNYEWTFTVTGRTKNVVITSPTVVNIGWREAVVQAGYYYLDTGTRKRAMEVEEGTSPTTYRPTARPVLLDVNGAKTTTPYVEVIHAYPSASWTNLYLNL